MGYNCNYLQLYRKRMLACALALASSLGGALWTSEVQASPQDLFGHGARVSAMGATGAASVVGPESVWANPALLSLGRQRTLSLGFQAASFQLRARGEGLPGKIDAEPMRGMLIGAMLPLPFTGALKDRVAFGFSFFTPTNVIVRGRVLYPETPQFPLLSDRSQSVTIQAGLGVDLGRGIRVGVGVAALAAIAGTVIVATDTSGSVGTKVDDQLVASYAPLVGINYDLSADYRLGITYRGRLEARFAVRIEVYDLGSLTVPPFNIAGLAQFDPWQVQAEIARVRGLWKAALGLTFKRWSRYPGGPEPTVLCPPERPDCLALRPEAPGFHDTIVPRIGVEREVITREGWAIAARAGYFFEPSPAPEQQGTARLFDNSRHALTLGGGFALRGSLPLSLDLFAQMHLLSPREHAMALDDAKTMYGTAKTSGSLWVGGAVASVEF